MLRLNDFVAARKRNNLSRGLFISTSKHCRKMKFRTHIHLTLETDSQTVWRRPLMGDNTGKSSILARWFTSGLLDSKSMNEYRNINIEIKYVH